MQHTNLGNTQCPIARSLKHVGEWWSIIILRDAFQGLTRFDQFQKSLGIAPNMLARRLTGLVESGLLEKRQYAQKPPRFEYILTPKGQDFRPVLWALMEWGNTHFAPEGRAVEVVDRATGVPARPLLVDAATLRPLLDGSFRTVATPIANDRTRARHGVMAREGAVP